MCLAVPTAWVTPCPGATWAGPYPQALQGDLVMRALKTQALALMVQWRGQACHLKSWAAMVALAVARFAPGQLLAA